jgi:hypothetical protein
MVTHRNSTGEPSKELLCAAHILALSYGCPWAEIAEEKCPHFPCQLPQVVHCTLVMLQRSAEGQVCRVCGCTHEVPCPGGCFWEAEDLCSRCVDYQNVTDSVQPLAELEAAIQAERDS